jgi:hypothetical protein
MQCIRQNLKYKKDHNQSIDRYRHRIAQTRLRRPDTRRRLYAEEELPITSAFNELSIQTIKH